MTNSNEHEQQNPHHHSNSCFDSLLEETEENLLDAKISSKKNELNNDDCHGHGNPPTMNNIHLDDNAIKEGHATANDDDTAVIDAAIALPFDNNNDNEEWL